MRHTAWTIFDRHLEMESTESASAGWTVMPTTSRLSITTDEERKVLLSGMRPIHPGEVLREDYLVPLNLSSNGLAQALRVPATRIHEIVKERRAVSADTAMRLARFFSTSAELWMNLQTSYDLRKADVEFGERIASEVLPLKAA
jgi:addiction module HigA family antidote